MRVRFDAAEALGELQRLQLLDSPEERIDDDGSDAGAYTAVAPTDALQKLKTHWDTFLERCLRRRFEDGV